MFGIAHPRGSRRPLGAMHEGWVPLGGLGALHEVRGFVQYAQPLASTARGSWSSRSGPGRPVTGRCGSTSWRILVENPGFTRPLHSGLNPHHQLGKPRRDCRYTKRLIRRGRLAD